MVQRRLYHRVALSGRLDYCDRADIDLRKSLFNFQQMSAAAPQVVVSDPREKLFVTAAHKVEGGTNSAKVKRSAHSRKCLTSGMQVKDSESLVTLLRVFNQPEVLQRD